MFSDSETILKEKYCFRLFSVRPIFRMARTVHPVDSSESTRGLQENTLPVALLVSGRKDDRITSHATSAEMSTSPRPFLQKLIQTNGADISCSGINRHKQETLTPALHACQYSPDSNRYDLLPFLRPYVFPFFPAPIPLSKVRGIFSQSKILLLFPVSFYSHS